jgi:putative aldouronate transport system substrate-binding protein
MMREWYLAGYIPEDGLTYTGDQWRQLRNQNQLFAMPHNTYNPQNAELDINGITSRDWPVGNAVTLTGNIISTVNAVSSQSDRQAEAVQFLNWLWTSEEGYNMLVWGLEGRHYERLDDAHIRPDQDSGYYTNLPWMYGNTFQSYLLPNQDEGLFAQVRELNESSLKATSLGFVPDTDEIRTLVASVSAVLDQYMVPITGGYVDPDESIPELHAALDQAGLPELIDALQAQVDAWLASNR